MKINTDYLNEKTKLYSKKIEEYEDCMVNLYNVLNQASTSWKGKYCDYFIKNIEIQRRQTYEIISILKQIESLYKYIVQKYDDIGNRIYIDNQKNMYENKINAIIQKLNSLQSIVSNYQGNDTTLTSKIHNKNNKVRKVKRGIEDTRNTIITTHDKVTRIEENVQNKISKININNITELSIKDFI